MFSVGDSDGAVVDGPAVVVGVAAVVVVVVVDVAGWLPLLPHAAVSAPAAMIATAPTAAATRLAFIPYLMSVSSYRLPNVDHIPTEMPCVANSIWKSAVTFRILLIQPVFRETRGASGQD
jgi:hypothetical protein